VNTSRGYLVYLMRLWPAGEGRPQAWRASLENPHTGERHGFADLSALTAFLQEETAALPEAATAQGPEASELVDQASSPARGRDLYPLIGRALTDAKFRARLMEDPDRAAREEGYVLTVDQVAGIKASDLQSLAEIIDERLHKPSE